MSVRYSTRVGYGYYVTKEELKELPNDKLIDFEDNIYAFPIDSWNSDTCNYFFGIMTLFVAPGNAAQIPVNRPKAYEVSAMIDEFNTFFPNHEDKMCHDFVISSID